MTATGWVEDCPRFRTRSLSVDLRGDDGHLAYLMCSPLEQAVLQRLHKDLIWMLPGPDLAPHLYSKGLITPFEHEQFRAKMTLTEKNEHLLMSLSRRPAGVLESLLSCLDGNNDIPGVEELAKALRQKREDVELELSQAGSVAPLQTEAQTVQASPEQTVPIVVFEYLRDENKMLKKQNEALKNESEMLRQRAAMLEAKFECFKKRVQKLKEAIEVFDDEDYDSHSRHATENAKSWTNTLPLQESKSGLNAVPDFASSASSISSAHTPVISDDSHVSTPTEDVVRQPQSACVTNLERSYSMQNLSSQTSTHYYTEQQIVQKRHEVPLQQVTSMSVDEADIGIQTVSYLHAPNPPVYVRNGDSEQGGGVSMFEKIPVFGRFFKSNKQTTPISATDSAGQVQTERSPSSPHHNDSTFTSPRPTTPGEKPELSQMKTRLGGRSSSQHIRGQKETAVDKPSVQPTRKQPKPNSKSGAQIPEKPQPPPKSEAVKSKFKGAQNKAGGQTSQASSSSGKTRTRTQLKYAQLNKPQPSATADTTGAKSKKKSLLGVQNILICRVTLHQYLRSVM